MDASLRLPAAIALAALVGLTRPTPARAQQPDADVEIPAAPQPGPPVPPPAAPAPPPPPPAPQAASPTAAEIEALRREMREDRARLDARIEALEAELAAQKAAPPPSPPAPGAAVGGATPFASTFGKGAWALSAYMQAQYEQNQDSQDQIAQGGVYLNQDRFLVRRGRFGITAAWELTELTIELDANTVKGPVVSPKRLEASFVLRGAPWEGKLGRRGPRSDDRPPLAMLTVGLTDIPFGFELLDLARDRVFMERSLGSQAFFAGEQDLGAKLSGGVGWFRYAVAVMNGQPTGDSSSSPVVDPMQAKDFIGRLGFVAHPGDALRLAGGVSALYGKGFHAGTQATKPTVEWVDYNQNGVIDNLGELVGVPGMAATPSATFSHWAVGLDLGASLHTPIGATMLYGEVTLAQDLDRNLFVADPIASGTDVREIAAYAALVQEIGPYGLLGFRFDYYDPNADFLTQSGGKLLPSSQAIKTFSPLIGAQLPGRGRFLFQYDVVKNLLATGTNGVPTNLPDNQWTLRLQVQL